MDAHRVDGNYQEKGAGVLRVGQEGQQLAARRRGPPGLPRVQLVPQHRHLQENPRRELAQASLGVLASSVGT